MTMIQQNVIITQPQPQPITVPKILGPVHGHRVWSTDLCGCFNDVGTCLMTLCCMPCMECRNASRLGECNCLPYSCCPGASIAMRARLRTLGGIHGSICNDICVLACCQMCAVCQMSRELDYMGL